MPHDLILSAFKSIGFALFLCALNACASSDVGKINECVQDGAITAECSLAIRTQTETLIDEQNEEYLKGFAPAEAYELALEFADRNDYRRAQTLLSHSYRSNEKRDWNLLIDAQRAFLSKDQVALKTIREEMFSSEMPEEFRDQFRTLADQYNLRPTLQTELFLVPLKELRWPPYLEIVDGLIACFDAPFITAYSFDCRP